ncbi:MAG: ArsR family transcriptional regulator [Patescibacteria group bacterium]
MFEKEDLLLEMSGVFGALASDCRLEIIYLLLRVDALPSGEIARLTNCTPSQISQYLSKMYDAGILKKNRTWKQVEYSLDKSDPFVQGILSILSMYMK